MLIAAIADSHFDESSRFEECVAIHDWIVKDARRRGVDLIVHAGDVFERRSTPREREAVVRFAQNCAAVAPTVFVRGNHDPLGDLALLEYLETLHPIQVVEDARVVFAGGAMIGCLAWPRKAYLEQAGADAATEIRNITRGFGQAFADNSGRPSILLAHAMVNGSRTSTGQPLVGCEMEITAADLQLAGADVTVLGHIHKGQELGIPGAFYVGSPRRTAFGELEEKRYALIDTDDRGSRVFPGPSIEYVPTPARAMLQFDLLAGEIDVLLANGPTSTLARNLKSNNAEIRVRYTVEADERAAAATSVIPLEGHLKALGAHSVKIEEVVVPKTRARAPEIAEAETLEQKLDTLWESRGDTPEPERAARLYDGAHVLEEEVRNAD